MASSVDIQLEYLHAASLPHAFANERAELGYITEQISSLDHHISQLNALRRVLHHRSCQLHNLFSPISVLPVEVLSCVFRRFVDLGHDSGSRFYSNKQRLGRALVLSSVSSLFRHVAFCTPEIWMGISLNIRTGKAIGKASSLLQHCIALAPHVNISVTDNLNEAEARLATDILLTSDVTRKVKSFELYAPENSSHVWIEKLKSSSFPILDALKIGNIERDLIHDFGIFEALTQLNIEGCCLDRPIIVPPSLQRLNIWNVTRQVLISLLSLCPNLVECVVHISPKIIDDLDATNFIEPVALNHLNRLTYCMVDAAETNLLARSLRLPSLKTLKLCPLEQSKVISALPLCHNVSTTITTIDITVPPPNLFDCDDLYQLCRLSFPKLEELFLWLDCSRSFLSVIHALALLKPRNPSFTRSQIHNLALFWLRKMAYPSRFIEGMEHRRGALCQYPD